MKRFGGLLLLTLLGATAALLLFTVLSFPDWRRETVHDFERAISRIPNNTILYDLDGDPFQNLKGLENREVIPLAQISRVLQLSVLAAEDSRFFQHRGIDAFRLAMAVWTNLISGSFRHGASTITQQLVKLTLFSSRKTLTRKLREMATAIALEMSVPKEKILEYYLNSIYLGHGIYGVEQASIRFFAKSSSSLSLAQSALLAALIKKPEHYLKLPESMVSQNRYFSTEQLSDVLERKSYVLDQMLELNWISADQHRLAMEEELRVKIPASAHGTGAYFVQHVISLLKKKHRLELVRGGGWRVWTTFHPRLQNLVESTLGEYYSQRPATRRQTALVSIDPATGHVLALAGGRNFRQSQFNRATQAKRQPGSSIKPFLYATALEESFSPNAIFEDKVLLYEWEDEEGELELYSPQNADGLYGAERSMRNHRGENYRTHQLTLGKALEGSINTIAVQLLEEIGIGAFAEKAEELGIPLRKEAGLCLALGCSGIDLMSLTAAYTAFLNQGHYKPPVFILRIETASGEVIYEHRDIPETNVFHPNTVAQMVDLLSRVVGNGTGRNAYWHADNTTIIGKTGTSSDSRDTWFVGALPALLTGIWIGRDDNSPMPGEQGGGDPARLWRRYMRQALGQLPNRGDPPQPASLRVATCQVSGKMATDQCPDVAVYPYFEDQAPTDPCDLHPGGLYPENETSLPVSVSVEAEATEL